MLEKEILTRLFEKITVICTYIFSEKSNYCTQCAQCTYAYYDICE